MISSLYYAESGSKFQETTNCLLDGPTSESIRSLLRFSRITTSMTESPRIRLEADDDCDDWVSAAVTYYKCPQFDPHVRISWRGQPAIDTGGVRRQFFSTVFQQLAFSDKYRVFEGPPDRLRPVFRMSNISSGLLNPWLATVSFLMVDICQNAAITI